MSLNYCSPISHLLLIVFFISSCIVLYSTGVIYLAYIRVKYFIPINYRLYSIASFCLVCVFAYINFFAYILSPIIGNIFSIIIIGFALKIFITFKYRICIYKILKIPDVWSPFLFIITTGTFLIAITYMGIKPNEILCIFNHNEFINDALNTGSPDYFIQEIWFDGLKAGRPPWNNILDPNTAGTSTADRPPLLASILLLFWFFGNSKFSFVYFMSMTTAASLSWILAVWSICRKTNFSQRDTALLIILLSLTYYFWFFSLYTWPKALSGTLSIGTFIYLLMIKKIKFKFDLYLAGFFAGLSMFSHFSSIFILVAIYGLFCFRNHFFSRLNIITLLLIPTLIIGPYILLKLSHESSFSHLAKYSLTDEIINQKAEINKNIGILNSVVKFYDSSKITEIAKIKYKNFQQIFDLPCFFKCENLSFFKSRGYELWPIFGSLKYFNIGWILLLIYFTARKDRLIKNSESYYLYIKNSTAVIALSLFLFAITVNGAVENIIASGISLLMFTVTGMAIIKSNKFVIHFFIAALIINFLVFTLFIAIEKNLRFNYYLLTLAMITIYIEIKVMLLFSKYDYVKLV